MKIIRLPPSSLLPDTCEWYLLPGYLNHPYGIGNKLWKLEGTMADFFKSGKKEIISFGGAYSNHLHALAVLCNEASIPFTAIVRGEEPASPGYTLRFLKENNAKVVYLDRSTYRAWTQNSDYSEIKNKFENAYIIPEGGTSKLIFSGFESVAGIVKAEFEEGNLQHIIVAGGTGGTAAGLISTASVNTHIHVINVLKNKGLDDNITELLKLKQHIKHGPYSIHHDFHFGGYAKFDQNLIQWINDFYEIYGVPLDPVYTGKMIYAAANLANKSSFKKNEKVLLIHTGGLQGIIGFNERYGNILKIHSILPL
ncbi:MAG: pyridoxal-phosphate dependent enzyme [Saprospiraceae bacterium]|nr:pyridoxal-phosphate dependent enzyme [Saprospiraceae bacterium]